MELWDLGIGLEESALVNSREGSWCGKPGEMGAFLSCALALIITAHVSRALFGARDCVSATLGVLGHASLQSFEVSVTPFTDKQTGAKKS